MFKFMLTILGAEVEMERELTVERSREGMAKAKIYGNRSGRPIGRPSRQMPANFKKYSPIWKDGDTTVTDFARLIGVSRPMFCHYIKEYEAEAKV